MNFHAKSGVCSSKNERVMALGTKEDGHTLSPFSYLYSSDYTVQTSICEIVQGFGQFMVLFRRCTTNDRLSRLRSNLIINKIIYFKQFPLYKKTVL